MLKHRAKMTKPPKRRLAAFSPLQRASLFQRGTFTPARGARTQTLIINIHPNTKAPEKLRRFCFLCSALRVCVLKT
jgi:hypothetical protein